MEGAHQCIGPEGGQPRSLRPLGPRRAPCCQQTRPIGVGVQTQDIAVPPPIRPTPSCRLDGRGWPPHEAR
eukprot:15460494-Alexandrium_andersonii.AAC.1